MVVNVRDGCGGMRIDKIGTLGKWVVIVGMLVWAACGGQDRPSPPRPNAAKTGAGQNAQAPSSVSALDSLDETQAMSYIYTPVGKRDPFKSFYKIERKPNEESPGGILTKFEIDQLKLTAIISGIAKPRAQVELPDGRGVSVQVGTRIGKNFGRVVRIKTGEVIIAEDYRDWGGRKVTNYIHMKLRREETKP